MKKFFSKFLIVILILGFFLAPATPKIDTQNHLSLVKNEVKAQNQNTYGFDVTEIITSTNENISDKIFIVEKESGLSKTDCDAKRAIAVEKYKDKKFHSISPCKIDGTDELSSTVFVNAYDQNGKKITDTNFFNCNLLTNPTLCVLATIYYIIWTPISWITILAGYVLDFFLWYSLQSNSYEVDFVKSGWGLVRDIANLFFLVALLYIAGKTVLGLNSSNNKKVISMVIIMALLINFSLFISQVVIDSSNILARVFYASIENKGPNGEENIAGEEGEKSISVGLVKTFDPQKLFIQSGRNTLNDDWTTIGTFAILMIVTGALMIYMIITFFSIAFIFVGRVVGLWILMIFAPLAFASYTIPDFKIPKIGHGEWWNDLIKLSFMAPVFLFFLYLIVSFGDVFELEIYGEKGEVFQAGSDGNVDNIKTYLSVIIPFGLIYMLLKQAKETTIKMAGDIAQGVNTAGKLLTGATLGLAAGGVALAGRKMIGETLARASRGDTLSQRAANNDFKDMNWVQRSLGKIGAGIGMHKTFGDTMDIKTRTIDSGIGGRVNKNQEKLHHIDQAKNNLSTAMKNAHIDPNRKFETLSGAEQVELMKQYTKLKKTEIENDIKEGREAGVESKSQYEKNNRQSVSNNILNNPNALTNGDAKMVNGVLELTDQGKKNVESELSTGYNQILKQNTERISKEKFEHDKIEASKTISIEEKAYAKSTSSNYDMRDFKPELKGLNITSKASLFVLGMIANRLRSTLKTTDMNPGKGSGDFTKDLTTIIAGALKGMKIDIKSGGGGHDSHGGGHDDHGHGGGGHH